MPFRHDRAERQCRVCVDFEVGEAVVARHDAAVAYVPSRLRRDGSVVVAPTRHVRSPGELTEDEMRAVWRLLAKVTEGIEAACDPEGLHTWSDIGDIADGDCDHYCIVVVPRHEGDGYRYAKPRDVPVVDRDSRRGSAALLRKAVRS